MASLVATRVSARTNSESARVTKAPTCPASGVKVAENARRLLTVAATAGFSEDTSNSTSPSVRSNRSEVRRKLASVLVTSLRVDAERIMRSTRSTTWSSRVMSPTALRAASCKLKGSTAVTTDPS